MDVRTMLDELLEQGRVVEGTILDMVVVTEPEGREPTAA
jgi:hypothetical protein